MFALVAALVFAVAAVIVLVDGFVWTTFLLFLGLALLAVHVSGYVGDRVGRRGRV